MTAYTTPAPYLDLGWHLLPIQPGTKIPLDGQGLKHATNNYNQIVQWGAATTSWAVACSASGILALDVDKQHDGEPAWERLLEELGPLPHHPIQRTPQGGWHHLFKTPGKPTVGGVGAKVKQGETLVWPIDVKHDGYTLIAPSDGYIWEVPPFAPLPDLPPQWLEHVLKPEPKRRAPSAPRVTGETTKYGARALENECQTVATCPEGGRNQTLNKAAFAIGGLAAGGEVDPSDGRSSLEQAARDCGLPDGEAQKTIHSGWTSGEREPRTAPALALAPEPPPGDEVPPRTDEEAEQALAVEDIPRDTDIIDKGDWKNGLITYVNKDGKEVTAKTAGNLALYLAHWPKWCGAIGYDELAHCVRWRRAPISIPGMPNPSGRLKDEHYTWVQHAARVEWKMQWSKSAVIEAVTTAAMTNRYHPVKDYLGTLEWDGKPRLDSWLKDYMGATGEYASMVGRWWIISAVARAYRPGCQVDHLLVLEGKQGLGKSSAIRTLGGAWYSGNLGKLTTVDGAQSLLGKWIMEIGELDALKGAAATRVKDFITLTCDDYRPSYGRNNVHRPRQCVFCGSTNEDAYLHDPTGARRFWPVKVRRIDKEALARDRDQLWAQARDAYENGARWWPEGTGENEILAKAAEERFERDPWEDEIADYAMTQVVEFTINDCLKQLGVEVERRTRRESMRVGTVLRRLGCQRQHTRDGNTWRRPR